MDADFPHAAVRAVGYEATTFGQKTYNGVAILSKVGLDDVVCGFDDGREPDLGEQAAGVEIGKRAAFAAAGVEPFLFVAGGSR